MKIEITKDLKIKILKALRGGKIAYHLILSLSRLQPQPVYHLGGTTTETGNTLIIDRDLKIILLNALTSGFIDTDQIKKFAQVEQPLFKSIF